jgi:hypothetical protein
MPSPALRAPVELTDTIADAGPTPAAEADAYSDRVP